MAQHSNLSLIVLFHFQLVLFELVDLVTDQLHLLDLLGDLILDLFRGATLILEFGSQRVHNLIKTMVWLPGRSGSQIGIAAVLGSIEHGECGRRTGIEDGKISPERAEGVGKMLAKRVEMVDGIN